MLSFLSRSPFSNLLIAMCFDFSVLATEEAQSDDGEENSILEDSGTDDTTAENDSTTNSSAASLLQQQNDRLRVTNGLNGSASARSHASTVAASRGLSVAVSDKASKRQSRMIGLPHSPRPHHSAPSPSPRTPQTPQANSTNNTLQPGSHSPASGPHSPAHTPK